MAVQDPQSRIERLIAGAEARFQVEFLAVVTAIKNSISLDDLADLLAAGRINEAFTMIGQAAARLGTIATDTFVVAGTDTATWLNANVGEIQFDFDMTNERAVRAMRNNKLRLVTNFTEQQRQATQQALIDGIQRGDNPREIARLFRESIGLTPQQERWIRNYERELRNLDRGALARELRDRRFDRTVVRAIERGEPLTQAQIDKMVERYRQRALKLRAETIARTEALRSAHEGVAEMYEQAIEGGVLGRDQLIREWNTAADERVRDFSRGAQTSHRTMHHQTRLVGEYFVSGAGNTTLNPGAFGVAMEDINCRCVVTTRILSLDELPALASITIL